MKNLTLCNLFYIIEQIFVNIRSKIINNPVNYFQGIRSDSVLKLKDNIAVEYFENKALVLNLNSRILLELDIKESWVLSQIISNFSLKQLTENYINKFSMLIDKGIKDVMLICGKFWDQQLLCPVKNTLKGVFMDNTYYIQNPDVNIREEDEDGALLFNPDMDQVQLVSKTGFYIWKLCAKEHSVTDIVNAFKNDYDEVPEQEVIADVEEFINKMAGAGFLGTVDKS